MNDKLEEIRKIEMEQYEVQYVKGERNMSENMPNTPLKITDTTLDETVKKYGTVAIDCWAPWCGPCRMVAPVIEDLAQEMQGKIVFGKLNVDENQATSMKYNIMGIPTLLVFKNGNFVDNIVGAMPKEMLKARLAPYE